MSYIPNFFKAEELVPPNIYNELDGNINKICFLFDNRLLWTIDQIRRKYGPCIINNWKSDGMFSERGLRDFNSKTGAKWSQHKFGRAIDIDIYQGSDLSTRIPPQKIRQDILDDPWCDSFKYITALEMDINWLHISTQNWNKKQNGILKIYP